MTSAGTLWRSVRHLKARQIFGRAWFRLHRPGPDLRAAPALRAAAGPWIVTWMRAAVLTGPARMQVIGVDVDLDRDGWDPPSLEKLVRYNLHYFDDLNACDALQRRSTHRALLERWVKENPPGQGTGWEPYPLSLRLVNWIRWFLAGEVPQPGWLHTLAIQARWLSARLEFHLLGNHLFANAKALVFAGLFFGGREAESWLSRGLRILERELPEQILADGGHFERSPMYHAITLQDLLDLTNVIAARAPRSSIAQAMAPALRESAGRMLGWLRSMVHPDRTLGMFNDAAEGIAPSLPELEEYAARLGITGPHPAAGIVVLPDSGYVRAARGEAVALLDVAALGPDYLPAHAHADTLSFELSVNGRRIVVNGGTSCYGTGSQRAFERSTAAHSTVEVDGRDSSEVWSGFRVGRRARPSVPLITQWTVAGEHDGYRFLAGSPVHRRRWTLGEAELRVDDEITNRDLPAVARYILAPDLRLQRVSLEHWKVLKREVVLADIQVLVGYAEPARATHAPRFGSVLATDCLIVRLVGGRAGTRWTWSGDAKIQRHVAGDSAAGRVWFQSAGQRD